jgi:molybdenum cofactor synthesis domain-containing protein
MLTAVVITVSDSCARGERADASGPAVAALLREKGFEIVQPKIVSDEQLEIEAVLKDASTRARLIVTTGGTGIAPRDVTPEATLAVCGCVLDGVAERMRAEGSKKTPLAALSRGICGVRDTSLILNVPGSPSGATESLAAVVDLLPHALQLLSGETAHND